MGSKSKKNVIYLIYSILWSNVLNIGDEYPTYSVQLY